MDSATTSRFSSASRAIPISVSIPNWMMGGGYFAEVFCTPPNLPHNRHFAKSSAPAAGPLAGGCGDYDYEQD
jgi:hypothetical protein